MKFFIFLKYTAHCSVVTYSPTYRGGASRSSMVTHTVSTSYPRVSHGSCLGFMLMLFSYLHFVCLQQRFYLCYDVFDSMGKSTL